MNDKINIILGAGEVGSVLKESLHGAPKTYDKGQWEGETHIECDYLHIAIPYTENFKRIYEEAEKIFSPDIIVIHSTVKPGTSKDLQCLFSPVMGRHEDDFINNVRVYRKMFAGDKKQYNEIKGQFKLECEYWNENTSELEYSKVMSTTRMYWDLIFNKEIARECKKYGFEFNNVYARWTDNYNAGIELKHWNWKRPIYTEMIDKFPGGHCLRPNIHLADNEITMIIKAWEKDIAYIVSKKTTTGE